MTKMVLAGAKSVFGLSELKSAFYSLGIEIFFVDAPFMAKINIHDFPETEEILYTAEIPPSLSDAKIIPLSEFWISYCIKKGSCLISERALKASRSKKYLYEILQNNNFDFPKIFQDETEAEKEIENGKKIVIKPEGLHSGYGIEIIDKTKKSLLSKYIEEAKSIKNRTLRLMEIENSSCLLTECLEGVEYSADCFWYKNRNSIVRVCSKKIILINDKPCTAVYELLPRADDKIQNALENWMKLLFDDDDISFAQFDFIVTEGKRIVLIDFASRVGGGISDLLIESVIESGNEHGINPYANAVRGKSENLCSSLKSGEKLFQFNYLPTVTGYITDDNYNLMEGSQHIFKRKGDYVISNPSSVGSRIATVVKKMSNTPSAELLDSLLVGKKNIG